MTTLQPKERKFIAGLMATIFSLPVILFAILFATINRRADRIERRLLILAKCDISMMKKMHIGDRPNLDDK